MRKILLALGCALASVSIAEPHSVALSWNRSTTPGVTYNVYRSTTSGGPYTKLSSVSGLSYTDQAVADGGVYYYVVTAKASTESKYSNEVRAQIPIAAPSGLILSNQGLAWDGQGDLVALMWTPVAGAAGYNIYWATSSGGPYMFDGSASIPAFADLDGFGYHVYYVVTAVDANGNESGYSSEVSVIT